MTETEPTPEPDLRRARRERGVNAVLDTALEVFLEGDERPTANEIARRAGVSTSSFFRYFASIDDLRTQAAARYVERNRELLEPGLPATADFEDRHRRFVDLRIRAGVTLGPASRRLQGRAAAEPGLVPIQEQFRALLASQVTTCFAAELASATPARRADLIALIDSMTSIEAYQILHETHGRTDAQIRRAWSSALGAILETISPPDTNTTARGARHA